MVKILRSCSPLLLFLALVLGACGDNTAAVTSAPAGGAATTSAPAAAATSAPAAAATTSAPAAAANSAAAGAATSAAAKAASGQKVIIGSKDFTESILVAEMYAAALENAGIPVTRKLNIGTVEITQQAILKGDISLYPEYTGTALLNVLKLPKDSNDPKAVYDKVVSEYQKQFKLNVLNPAPFNDTNAIVVSKAAADKYKLKTLSDLAPVAKELRFAAIPDFIGPRSDTDGLGSLKKTYGGFDFKEVKSYEIKLKYKALQSGDADAAVAFSTDGEISGYGFVLLKDDKNNFPPYQLCPVVREDILAAYPNIKTVLDGVSSKLTDDKMSALNWRVDGPEKMEAVDVAKDFLKKEGLIK